MKETFKVSEGINYPLGATVTATGVNFALFSQHAEAVEVCLFDASGERELARISLPECSEFVWHGHIEGLETGALYGYRVSGPYEPYRGHRFNHHKLLLDPYARDLSGEFIWHESHYGYVLEDDKQDLSFDTRDNAAYMPKCRVSDQGQEFHHQRPNINWRDTIIYESHVKGFTRLQHQIPTTLRGTFAGFSRPESIAYLRDLGITTVELLPVQGFIDEDFLSKKELNNYWGYNSIHFFTPHGAYASKPNERVEEFRAMVDQLHQAGLEVIIDVVYNHTAEGNHLGPTLSFKGIDNLSYYGLQTRDYRFYVNDTGCGNTLNLKHPRVLQMVIDSLRYWVTHMGVDGFRFDLATVLGREAHGFDAGAGFFDIVRQDPILSTVKLIAEPWDIGPGGYQLGHFPSGWHEWNDSYRDTCRRFWHGDAGVLPEFARRIHGSSDIFEYSGRSPSASINFVTSHDGFTLADLVSYNHRHNLDNKENNADGHHANFSHNHGVEGPTEDPSINALRQRQQRNLLATLLISLGTPMLNYGDEIGRTQNGNNNAYCQDNDISWFPWEDLTLEDWQLKAFVRKVIEIRKTFSILRHKHYIHEIDENNPDTYDIHWLNTDGEPMRDEQWTSQHVHALAWQLESIFQDKPNQCLLTLFNGEAKKQYFQLPKGWHWQPLLDSSQSDGEPKNNQDLNSQDINNQKMDGGVHLVEKSLLILQGTEINT